MVLFPNMKHVTIQFKKQLGRTLREDRKTVASWRNSSLLIKKLKIKFTPSIFQLDLTMECFNFSRVTDVERRKAEAKT